MTPEDLVEFEQIRQLKHRYMRCVDQKKYDELAQCFTEDATTSYMNGKLTYSGRDEIIRRLRAIADRPTLRTCHRVTQPELELLSPTEATGIWALEETGHDTDAFVSWHAAAFYTDRYSKADGQWRIAHTGYEQVLQSGTYLGFHGFDLRQRAVAGGIWPQPESPAPA